MASTTTEFSSSQRTASDRDEREEKWRTALDLMTKFPMLAGDLKEMVKNDMASFLGLTPTPAPPPPPSVTTSTAATTIEVKQEHAARHSSAGARRPPPREPQSDDGASEEDDTLPAARGKASTSHVARHQSERGGNQSRQTSPRKPAPAQPRTRASRWSATDLTMLNAVFEKTPYPSVNQIQELRRKLHVPKPGTGHHCAVQKWFSKRRAEARSVDPDIYRDIEPPRATPKWSEAQRVILEEAFQETDHPDTETIRELRKRLGVPRPKDGNHCRIQLWFYARRSHEARAATTAAAVTPSSTRQWTKEERRILEDAYEDSPYPSREKIIELRELLDVPTPQATSAREKFYGCQITKWFSNRRQTDKRRQARGGDGARVRPRVIFTRPPAAAYTHKKKKRSHHKTVARTTPTAAPKPPPKSTSKSTPKATPKSTPVSSPYRHLATRTGASPEKPREHWTPDQLNVLMEAFGDNPLPDRATLGTLRQQLGVVKHPSEERCRIQRWFKRQRSLVAAESATASVLGKRKAEDEVPAEREVVIVEDNDPNDMLAPSSHNTFFIDGGVKVEEEEEELPIGPGDEGVVFRQADEAIPPPAKRPKLEPE